MTAKKSLQEILADWELPEGPDLLARVEEMVRPALLAGYFGRSFTRFVSGLQYHLGGAQDTRELAGLAALTAADRVLDVCCFIGGPAIQLASEVGCHVTGVDLDAGVIAAAVRIAGVTDLRERLAFAVADAASLPFADATFTVVWNQCSLESDERWLREFDRVLSPGGRFAFTFQRSGMSDTRWTLADLSSLLEGLGYSVVHAEDITARDIDIGWKALDRKLSEREVEYRAVLGEEWVRAAHREFQEETRKMERGEYGNARVVAVKPGVGGGHGRERRREEHE